MDGTLLIVSSLALVAGLAAIAYLRRRHRLQVPASWPIVNINDIDKSDDGEFFCFKLKDGTTRAGVNSKFDLQDQ